MLLDIQMIETFGKIGEYPMSLRDLHIFRLCMHRRWY